MAQGKHIISYSFQKVKFRLSELLLVPEVSIFHRKECSAVQIWQLWLGYLQLNRNRIRPAIRGNVLHQLYILFICSAFMLPYITDFVIKLVA